MSAAMRVPTGPAVAFLFTDIEGSTRSERTVGLAAWAEIVGRHDALLSAAIEANRGVVVKTEGDAFFAAFADPLDAVTAAAAAQRALAAEPWQPLDSLRVRMGIHLGEGRLRSGRGADDPEDYVGIDVNYAARIAAAANGAQIVLSRALAAALPPDLDTRPGLAAVSLADEGQRTVKDFDEPLPLFRLVVPGAAEDARPLRTTDAPSNLPGDVTSFVGRAAELAEVRDDLATSRIVTLTGPGGSGKTRLALAAARELRDRFPHGTWFVDLAAIRDPALIEPAIAQAIGVRETPELTVEEALGGHLRDRLVLLVLDNLEQLLPDGAQVVAGLVRGAPGLRVIVTSRELLRIGGEHGHAIPPLEVDTSVSLFIDRAREHRPDLVLDDSAMTAIRSIAERLGGLPLAIELAAARTRLLAPAQILERLGHSLDLRSGARDLPERQRTLRAAIAWSEELLSDDERTLFARLSVFADGWTAATAMDVVEGERPMDLDLVDGLESLADKSLIRIEAPPPGGEPGDGEARFGMHPLLREYALERLEASGQRPELERRFATVFAGLAAATGPAILSQGGDVAMRRLDREARNVRAAVDWCIASGELDLGLRVVSPIWRWYQQRGRLREGRALLDQLLAHPEHGDSLVRIAALAAVGGLGYWMDDFAGATAAYEQRLALATATGDPSLIADGHYDLGFMSMTVQDLVAVREHEQRALDLYLAAGRQSDAIRARQALVVGTFLAGDYPAARALELENLSAFRAAGSRFEIADSLTLMTGIHYRLGEPAEAWTLGMEGLRIFGAIDSASGLVRNLGMASIVQLAAGDPVFGARIAGALYRLMRDKGVMLAPVKILHLPDPAGLAVERLGADRAAELMAEGEVLTTEEIVAEVLAAPSPG
jgi:predicted ATPase/class 3 adenylate cyclase